MSIARSAWSVLTVLVGPVALTGLGIAAVVVWTHAGKGRPDNPETVARVGRATFSDDGWKVRATLDVPDSHASTALVIYNAAGTERATVILDRNGSVMVESAGATTDGFVASLDPDGSMTLGAANDRTSVELHASRDGGTDLIVRNAAKFPVHGVRVTPEGDVIPHAGGERPKSQPAP